MLSLLLILACGDSPEAPPAAAVNAPAAAAPVGAPSVEEAPVAQALAPKEAAEAPEPTTGARPSPKAMDTLPKELCEARCGALTVYPFEYVRDNYCPLCGPHDEWACELDWPTNDVPSCDIYDELRNCIYATYGRPFTSDRWKAYFAEQPWYKADPSYSDARLSDAAKANVEFLIQAKKDKLDCAG